MVDVPVCGDVTGVERHFVSLLEVSCRPHPSASGRDGGLLDAESLLGPQVVVAVHVVLSTCATLTTALLLGHTALRRSDYLSSLVALWSVGWEGLVVSSCVDGRCFLSEYDLLLSAS